MLTRTLFIASLAAALSAPVVANDYVYRLKAGVNLPDGGSSNAGPEILRFETPYYDGSQTLMAGEHVEVEWDSPAAEHCSLNTHPGLTYSGTGMEVIYGFQDDVLVELTCFDDDGHSTASIDLEVQNTVLTTSIASQYMDYGSYGYIGWASDNVDSCEASGDWIGEVPIEASDYQVGPVYGRADFDLTCTGPEGSVTKGVTAFSRPFVDAGNGSVAAKSASISSGESLTIAYEYVGANECRALRVPSAELDQAIAWRDSFDGSWSEFRGQYPIKLVAGVSSTSDRVTGGYTTGPITEDSAILVNCVANGYHMDKEKTVLTVDVQ